MQLNLFHDYDRDMIIAKRSQREWEIQDTIERDYDDDDLNITDSEYYELSQKAIDRHGSRIKTRTKWR